MMYPPKTVLCLHDLSGLGRSSLSVILPVLSALGVQPIAVPTAVLSSHTGGLGIPARMASIDFAQQALAQYRQLGMRFDAIYTGYLNDPAMALLAQQAISIWPDALAVVDPVMGDDGHVYSGVSADVVGAMYGLCRRADLILPNTTEAALLLEQSLNGQPATPQAAAQMAEQLTKICPGVVITGVPDGHSIGCAGAFRSGERFFVRNKAILRSYPGTGDIFAAVVVGRMVQGNVPQAAVEAAARFVGQCIRATPENADSRLGVWLEQALPLLRQENLPPQPAQ